MFRTAVSGFKKDEVLAYIDKRDAEARQKQESLEQRLRKVTADCDEAEAKYAEAAAHVDNLMRELSAEREHSAQLERNLEAATGLKNANESKQHTILEEVDRLQKENADLQAERNHTNNQMQEMKQHIKELEGSIAKLNKKLESTSKSEDLIGRVLVEAQSSADKVMEKAQQNATTQITDAEETAKNLLNDAKDKAVTMLNNAQEEMANTLEKAENFQTEANDLREATRRAFSHIDSLLENMENAAERIRTTYEHMSETVTATSNTLLAAAETSIEDTLAQSNADTAFTHAVNSTDSSNSTTD